jgi:hypothetical protein
MTNKIQRMQPNRNNEGAHTRYQVRDKRSGNWLNKFIVVLAISFDDELQLPKYLKRKLLFTRIVTFDRILLLISHYET